MKVIYFMLGIGIMIWEFIKQKYKNYENRRS